MRDAINDVAMGSTALHLKPAQVGLEYREGDKTTRVPSLTVLNERPPNFKEIAARFGAAAHQPGVLFTYGATIYFPSGLYGGRKNEISRPIYLHEGVHSHRQGADPAAWWDRYLRDKDFRLAEELVAHQVEYMCAVDAVGRGERRRYLSLCAHRLSGPLYGRMISLDKAKARIKGDFAAGVPA